MPGRMTSSPSCFKVETCAGRRPCAARSLPSKDVEDGYGGVTTRRRGEGGPAEGRPAGDPREGRMAGHGALPEAVLMAERHLRPVEREKPPELHAAHMRGEPVPLEEVMAGERAPRAVGPFGRQAAVDRQRRPEDHVPPLQDRG